VFPNHGYDELEAEDDISVNDMMAGVSTPLLSGTIPDADLGRGGPSVIVLQLGTVPKTNSRVWAIPQGAFRKPGVGV